MFSDRTNFLIIKISNFPLFVLEVDKSFSKSYLLQARNNFSTTIWMQLWHLRIVKTKRQHCKELTSFQIVICQLKSNL